MINSKQVREQDPEGPGSGAAVRPGAVVQRRRRKGRRRQINGVRCDEEGFEKVSAAATGAGMTRAGWVSEVAVAVAGEEPPPRVRVDVERLRELAETRRELVRVGTLLNQAARATNASGVPSAMLGRLAGRVTVLVEELDRLATAAMSRGHV